MNREEVDNETDYNHEYRTTKNKGGKKMKKSLFILQINKISIFISLFILYIGMTLTFPTFVFAEPTFQWLSDWEVELPLPDELNTNSGGQAETKKAFGTSADNGQKTNLTDDKAILRSYSFVEAAYIESSRAKQKVTAKRRFRLSGSPGGWNVDLNGVLRGIITTNDILIGSVQPFARVVADAQIRSSDGHTTQNIDFDVTKEKGDTVYGIEPVAGSSPAHSGTLRKTKSEKLPDGDYEVNASLVTHAGIGGQARSNKTAKADFFTQSLAITNALGQTLTKVNLGWEVNISVRDTTSHVTKADDTSDGTCDGDCSLREAIIAANETPGHDVIYVPAGTYTLSIDGEGEDYADTGDLDVTDDLTIIGAGAIETIIDGDKIDRVFHIIGNIEVALHGLTIQNGNANRGDGGGILNDSGTVTLFKSTLAYNLASGNGGGIANFGNGAIVNIRKSTLADNDATCNGGGVDNGQHNKLRIENSTLYRNNARNYGKGGGIFNTPGGRVTIINSTFAYNLAGEGAGIFNTPDGRIFITNSTLAYNHAHTGKGFEIFNLTDGRVAIASSILANYESKNNCFGTVNSEGFNLASDESCGLVSPDDIVGAPRLGAFIHPITPGNGYFPLLSDSPAIDAGSVRNSTNIFELPVMEWPWTDQLGRPVYDGTTLTRDIGAIEYIPIVNGLVLQPEELITTSFNPDPVLNAPAGTFTITATFNNKRSSPHILNPFFKVAELSGGNLLLNADGGAGGVGATLTPDVGDGGILSPEESFAVDFVIGLQTRNCFRFFVDLLGVPGT